MPFSLNAEIQKNHTSFYPKNKAQLTLQWSFLLFILFSITQENDDIFRAFYFVGIIPSTIYILINDHLYKMAKSRVFLANILLLSVLYSSIYWSTAPINTYETIRYTRWFIETTIFFTAITCYARLGLHKTTTHGYLIQASIILSTIISITTYITNSEFPARMTGPGLLDDIIPGSSIIIVLWVISLTGLNLKDRKDIFLSSTSLILVTAYILLNQSRAPLGMAALAWPIMIFIASKNLKTKTLAITITSTTIIALIVLSISDLSIVIHKMNERGMSYRPAIWEATLANYNEFFWHGIGIGTPMSETKIGYAIKESIGVRHNHPHNLFLSVWVHGGIFAFGLITLTFLTLTYRAIIRAKNKDYIHLWILTTLIGVCMTDPYKLIGSPQEVYLFFWTPLGILCGSLTRTQRLSR